MRRLSRRCSARADDRGSIAMAMLLILVGVSLTSLITPVFVVQRNSTVSQTRRVDAINAAQAGLEYAMGQIRAAKDGTGDGVLTSLPTCSGSLTGNVNGAGTASFSVKIEYFNAASTTTPMCSSGKPATTPKTALLTAAGTQAAVTRTLTATYTFQSSNANIPGGLIRVFKTATSNDLCLDAGSAQPAASTILKVKTCDATVAQQRFAYYDDLTIVLVNTNPAMCVDADTPHAAGGKVRLKACVSPAPARQRWAANKYANFDGTADSVNTDNTCLNVDTPNLSGSDVVLGTKAAGTCQKPHDNEETFIPEAAVGAGAAGPPQLVNYEQFGRCLDVPGNDPSQDTMISWPCKQAFDRATIASNESWTLPTKANGPTGSTGLMTTYDDSEAKTYCLQSPGLTATPYPTLTATCPSSGTPTSKKWTVYWDTGDYSTSYRIRDGYGNCLQPTDPDANPPDLYPSGDQISKIIVAPCNGSTLQKWNAPANVTGVLPLRDINEK